MADAGLTHGALYGHCASKEEFVPRRRPLTVFGSIGGYLQFARALTDTDLSSHSLARSPEIALKLADDIERRWSTSDCGKVSRRSERTVVGWLTRHRVSRGGAPRTGPTHVLPRSHS